MWTSYDKRFCRESKVYLCYFTLSPYRISISERTDHTVITGMEKHLDVKITLRRINLQGNAVKKYDSIHDRYIRDIFSGSQWLKWDALNRWSKRWTSLQVRTTPTTPARKRLYSTVAIGGSTTQMWHTLIQYPQGTNLNSKMRCQQCNAWSEQRTKRNKKHWHKNSSSSSSWHWHASWWESDFECSPQRWYDHW